MSADLYLLCTHIYTHTHTHIHTQWMYQGMYLRQNPLTPWTEQKETRETRVPWQNNHRLLSVNFFRVFLCVSNALDCVVCLKQIFHSWPQKPCIFTALLHLCRQSHCASQNRRCAQGQDRCCCCCCWCCCCCCWWWWWWFCFCFFLQVWLGQGPARAHTTNQL